MIASTPRPGGYVLPRVGGVLDSQHAVAPLFADGLGSGDLSHTENGAGWDINGQDNGSIAVVSDNPRSGAYSIRFRYDAVADDADSWVELGLSWPGVPSLWLEYYLWIPANYHHRAQSSTEHHKFLSLWGGDPQGDGKPKTTFELWRQGEGDSFLRILHDPDGGPESTELLTVADAVAAGGLMERGQWNRVRVHVDIGTDSAQDDGVLQVWFGDTLAVNENTVPFWPSPETTLVWNTAYLMGYTNGGYDEQTDFYLDELALYTSNPGWAA